MHFQLTQLPISLAPQIAAGVLLAQNIAFSLSVYRVMILFAQASSRFNTGPIYLSKEASTPSTVLSVFTWRNAVIGHICRVARKQQILA